MEKPILKNQQIQQAHTQTLVSSISHYNSLTAYPIPDEQFYFWAKIIERARPHTTSDEIREVIIKLAMGIEIQVDTRLGVQNILKHLFTKEEVEDYQNKHILEKLNTQQ